MNKTYKIIEGATTEYFKEDFSNNQTAKFLAKSEWRKVFLHEIDEDEDFIHVSQYEKTEKHKVPILLLEECEEKDEIIIEDREVKNSFSIDIPQGIKNSLYLIVIWIILWVVAIGVINHLKDGFVETADGFEQTWSGETLFEKYTTRIILLEEKENFEFQTQKELRDKKQKEIARLDELINVSIENVKNITEEKIEIKRQKIELAQ